MRAAASFLALAIPALPAFGWDLALPDTVRVAAGPVTLQDLASGPVPAAVADLTILAGSEPGTSVTVSRQGVLRRLVEIGAAARVNFGGTERSTIIFAGRELAGADLAREVRRAVQPLVPSAPPGAPASWFDLEIPATVRGVGDDWAVETPGAESLVPGRNLVACILRSGDHTERFTATVTLHHHGETAVATTDLARDRALAPALFDWSWVDLAAAPPGLVLDRETLAGASLVRNLAAGDALRLSDLAPTPVIRAGDPVDLVIRRPGVAVTVRGTARQPGATGQTIPVRNEITGRLVHATVAGPGLVEWRR